MLLCNCDFASVMKCNANIWYVTPQGSRPAGWESLFYTKPHLISNSQSCRALSPPGLHSFSFIKAVLSLLIRRVWLASSAEGRRDDGKTVYWHPGSSRSLRCPFPSSSRLMFLFLLLLLRPPAFPIAPELWAHYISVCSLCAHSHLYILFILKLLSAAPELWPWWEPVFLRIQISISSSTTENVCLSLSNYLFWHTSSINTQMIQKEDSRNLLLMPCRHFLWMPPLCCWCRSLI